MSTLVQRLDRWLLQPHSRLASPEKIQRSRLLATILLVLVSTVSLILMIVIRHDPDDINEPTVQAGFLLLGIGVLMYLINRRGHTSVPALGIILPFTAIFIYIPFYSGEDPIFLAFLLIPIVFTAIFFPFTWTATLSAGILLLVAVLLSFVDSSVEDTPYWNLRNMWFFLLLSTSLILTFMRHLVNLERIRQHELRTINEQLEEKVADLEQFTYTVSHELKTPVVTIKGFLGSVERDIQAGNLLQARKDFQRISKAADDLHNTLVDLLELSRVGRVVNPFENFPLADLVSEAMTATHGQTHAHKVEVRVAPDLPMLHADRTRLREVFENLIDNAAKYMGGQKKPVIEIGVRNGNPPVLFVKDNGMGIDPQYHAKIFGLFEKLDPHQRRDRRRAGAGQTHHRLPRRHDLGGIGRLGQGLDVLLHPSILIPNPIIPATGIEHRESLPSA
jgi:signal transduction histidine kinase